jgi:plastocyanin
MRNFITTAALLSLAQTLSSAKIIDVTVGGPGVLQYNPSFVEANLGDAIRFEFRQKNHTATQSSFAQPCVPLPGGFDTSFLPVADSVTQNFPVAYLNVTDLSPVWVYCRQANHCQQGMVFAVNPGDKFAAFQAAAASNPFGNASTTASVPPTTTTAAGTTTAATPSVTTPTFSTNTATTPAPTSTGSVDHKIIVGGPNILTYSPSNITAAIGDTITFEFHQKNHTVTQSSFDAPCRALASTSTTSQVGFDSGFMAVADSVTTGFPTFTITVNDTTPIWAYCRQVNHCGQGMVFAVNAVESGPKNFAAFQALAKQLNGTTTPSTPASDALGAGSFLYTSYAGIAFAAIMLLL